jgi:hypothetical protein
MNGSGPAALLYFLRNVDLTGFNVRKAPDTVGLRDQKLASLRNIDAWWYEILSTCDLAPGFDSGTGWEAGPVAIGREQLRAQYMLWLRGRRFDCDPLDDAHFGLRLKALVPSIEASRPRSSGVRIRQYVLPPLAECRSAFEIWLGAAVDWDTD